MSRLSPFTIIHPSKWLFRELGLIGGKAIIAQEYRKTYKSFKGVEYNIEEFIRQWVIQQLLSVYDYPEDWIGHRIVVEEPVYIGSTKCRVDIAIKNQNGEPIIFVETKTASASKGDMLHAERQLQSYLSATHSAIYGMVTNGVHAVFLEKKNNPNTFHIIEDLPDVSELFKNGLFAHNNKGVSEEENEITQEEAIVYPSVREYIRAFNVIKQYLTPNHKEMLKYHYYAPDQTVTMTELAQAVGYTSYRGGNLQYGKIGRLLCAELEWAYGDGISILASFTHPSESPNGQWLLTLHEEVADALRKLRWV